MATVTIRPDGNGTYTDWTGDYTDVDEVTLDENDYVTTDANSKKETFTLGDTGLASGPTINSVKVHIQAKYIDFLNKEINILIRSGSTDDTGAGITLDETTTEYTKTWTTDPDTGAAWTITAVDALEAGIASESSAGGGYIYQLWVVVDYTAAAVAAEQSFSFGKKRRIMV